MDVSKILAELKAEREQIEEAILSLERLVRGRGHRRGRPPAWMSGEQQPKRRGTTARQQEQTGARGSSGGKEFRGSVTNSGRVSQRAGNPQGLSGPFLFSERLYNCCGASPR